MLAAREALTREAAKGETLTGEAKTREALARETLPGETKTREAAKGEAARETKSGTAAKGETLALFLPHRFYVLVLPVLYFRVFPFIRPPFFF
ncbi:hypothetical protein [Sporolituus thermophilus]|uniref:Uncharacterized protein n=1 Tax=Sporolituus thermophilus DSM 23256 TaxID=1123285 RepID=A0A1G7MGA2_9FIRM|nr:hypothetical protein [Sporolituus thermophilus]SDF60757.1 hypothetical protein SAMN05660235_02138 [Sporolituus thermophilus DSM 23256]